jgi:hypothetical protein
MENRMFESRAMHNLKKLMIVGLIERRGNLDQFINHVLGGDSSRINKSSFFR